MSKKKLDPEIERFLLLIIKALRTKKQEEGAAKQAA